MNTDEFNNDKPNKESQNTARVDALYHTIMTVQILLNGISVGGTIRHSADMIKNGYSDNNMFAATLYALCAIYTGMKAYKIYKYNQQIKNNQNQR